jgi:eukaryotic-like serine/threonine-protein kinase
MTFWCNGVYLINRMCLNPGDIVNGRYEAINKLGRGGFGITYTASDNQQLSHVVVLKQITISQTNDCDEGTRDPDYLDWLRNEAVVLQGLNHPCIPQFYDSFDEGNYHYIVQEYIDGHDLSREIRPGEPINEELAVSMLREILAILQFVHGHNIIHRDIKPANIIRRERDQKLFLIDFGAVTEIATEYTSSSGITRTRIIQAMGYSPPEQLSGYPRANSDIYALGMMIMQGVTGFSINAICNPETAPAIDDQYNYIWQEYAPGISLKLKAIIAKMIRYSFRDRYETITEVLADLDPEPDNSIPSIIQSCLKYIKYIATNYRKTTQFLLTAIITSLLAVILFYFTHPQSDICSLSDLNDHLSCGEEILDPLSKGAIRNRATGKFQQQEYLEAFNYFQESWQEERPDAESLIYLNNAWLEANNSDYYTIALAVPLNSGQNKTIKSSGVAQDFLRGVAQAQTEVNLGLSSTNPKIKQQLSQYDFLSYRQISENNNKGLKVVIADDGNHKAQAQQIAKQIADNKPVLGIIGHYTSSITLDTVDIYQKKDLAQISYGSTSKEFTNNPKSNFFRVVYNSEEEASALLKYIEQNNYQDKKIAIFYNPNSEYSNRFKIELETQVKNLAHPNIKIIKEFDIANEQDFSIASALKQLDQLGVNICILLPDGLETNSLAQAIDILQQDNGKHLMLGGNPLALVNSKVQQIQATNPLNLIVSTFWHPTQNPESEFNQQTKQLWGSRVNEGTAMAYDATLAMIEAINRQKKPNRQGTIEQLKDVNFSVTKAVTGEIVFNTPKNGDRLNFYPTLVRLVKCQDSYQFAHLSLDDTEAFNLACQVHES